MLISTVDIENGETEVAALKRLLWKVAGQQNRVSANIYSKQGLLYLLCIYLIFIMHFKQLMIFGKSVAFTISRENKNNSLLQKEIDKLLGDGSTILKLKGIQSLKQEGISLCKKRLTTAADVFKKALGADFEMHFKEDDVEEGRSETDEEDDPEETPDDDFHENDFVMDSVLNSSLV